MHLADEISQHQYHNCSKSIYPNIDQHAPEKKILKFFDIHHFLLVLPNIRLDVICYTLFSHNLQFPMFKNTKYIISFQIVFVLLSINNLRVNNVYLFQFHYVEFLHYLKINSSDQ
jgi:hypothetical protein